jgi:hypothetical protein
MLQAKFTSTLSSQQIVVKADKTDNDDNSIAKIAGTYVPLIRFYDETIDFSTITQMNFSFGSDLLPTVSVILNDIDERLLHEYPVKVGSIFTIFLGNANDEVHKPIKGDFYCLSPNSGNGLSYSFDGVLHVPKLYDKLNRVFQEKTSLEVLEQLATEAQLGFVTNIDATNDRMNWIQYQSNIDFIKYLSSKIYIDDNAFVKVYIDQYWNLCVIDVAKAIVEKPKDTFMTHPLTGEKLEEDAIIQATNITQEFKKYDRLIYDRYSITDDYSSIAMTEPKKLSIIDLNTSSLEEQTKTYNSPHAVHLNETGSFTSFSNDNTYQGYFVNQARSKYKNLLIRGQQVFVEIPYFVAGLYLYMSFYQEIFNKEIYTGNNNQDPTSTATEDNDSKTSNVPSMKVTKNNSLSGDVLVTGMTISYNSTMVQNTSRMYMQLSLLLKPINLETIMSSRTVETSVNKYQINKPQDSVSNDQFIPGDVANNTVVGKNGKRYNIPRAVSTLTSRSLDKSTGSCARFVRIAMEGGGLNTSRRPVSAKNYDDYLPSLGFTDVSSSSYSPKTGDIAVIQSISGHVHGHICMFNGTIWISDFRQRDFWGGSAYRNSRPRVNFFRWV